jgi:hypothetical protein
MKSWLLMFSLVFLAAGCADRPPSDFRSRQDRALASPYEYSPFKGDSASVSGGGMTDFKKDDFKHDVNSVFAP